MCVLAAVGTPQLTHQLIYVILARHTPHPARQSSSSVLAIARTQDEPNHAAVLYKAVMQFSTKKNAAYHVDAGLAWANYYKLAATIEPQ